MQYKELAKIIDDATLFLQANLHTCTIGKISAVKGKLIDVEPVIPRMVDGKPEKLTVFPDVIPFWFGGGSSYETWPLAVGDYCLLIVQERCIDRWADGTDFAEPPEARMHDYSDSIALCGLKNLSQAVEIIDRIHRVGDMLHTGDLEHVGNTEQTGNFELTGNMTINGNLTVNGDITCTGILTVPTINTQTLTASTGATIGGKAFATHQHSGVTSGGSNTGGVA